MNKKGFTLIELLAVIIILGILMIIAIPSVTKYISDSRKSAYIDTAKEIISGARNIVNDGKLEMYDTSATYYIPVKYFKTENAMKSPYGDFTEAYVGVIYNGKGYSYYWISVDDTGQGVKDLVLYDNLNNDNIESDLTDEMIKNVVEHTVIGDRNTIKILDPNTETWKEPVGEITRSISETGEAINPNIKCKRATTLHTETCNNSYCSSKYGDGGTITYGNNPNTRINGALNIGDAFDCKVSTQGDYTERFYYISDYFNTETKSFDSSVAVLVYYTNVYNGSASRTGTEMYGVGQGAGNHCTNTSPSELINRHFPSKEAWDNVSLQNNGQRFMFSCDTHPSETVYDYSCDRYYYTTYGNRCTISSSGYTIWNNNSRMINIKELMNCSTNIFNNGGLDGCSFLYENTIYANSESYNYCNILIENPPKYGENMIYTYNPAYGRTESKDSRNYYHVRPVIEVKKMDIQY